MPDRCKIGLNLLLCIFTSINILAQSTFTLSGYINDANSGETLAGANIIVKEEPTKGAISNAYGFYSLSLTEGQYTLVISYLGFQEEEVSIDLTKHTRLNVKLHSGLDLSEVLVRATKENNNVEGTQMGTVDLHIGTVKRLPSLLGEVDILKALQLLPGVISAGEGNAGFYVRGGGPDQNLVLLDEAVVYNSGHMLGFFSIFNSDAIKNAKLIKGGMPANYGGRLSSVVDVQMKEGNDKHYIVEGGIGLVSSRLTIQGPIVKEKSSFILSGRRTYALDIAQPFLRGTEVEGTNYHFYDFNAKLNYRFSDKDRVYLSAYFGRDVLRYRNKIRDFYFKLPYGNTTVTLRWNHLFSDKLFMNVATIFNDYDFQFSGGQGAFAVGLVSGVKDTNAKIDFDFFPSYKHNLKFGLNYTFHALTPNVASASDGNIDLSNGLETKFAHEAAAYLLDDFKINDQFSLNLGLRYAIFDQLGPYTSPFTSQVYSKKERVVRYDGLEPRLSAKYTLDGQSSFKAGITFTKQYLHLVSNSTSTLPFDIWVPSTELVKPQQSIQYALGYFRNFNENRYEGAIEVYYKDLQQQIDYGENYVNNVSDELEQEFVFGKGWSYGVELFLKKRTGRLNGWIGYTWSRTQRSFDAINQGQIFPAVYDRTHDLALVANFKAGEKWELGTVIVFGTGNAFTPVKSLYMIDQDIVADYGNRNSARMPAYNRLDFSATFDPKPAVKKQFKSTWTFSIYNAYNRKNPFFLFYEFDVDQEEGNAKASAFQVSLFPLIPSITWNFRFKS